MIIIDEKRGHEIWRSVGRLTEWVWREEREGNENTISKINEQQKNKSFRDFFSRHFIPDNICMVSLYSGSQTLSPVRAPLWLNETILVGAGCSSRVQLQKNLSGLQFVILFSFKMMLGLCFPDIRGSNERSWVTIPWGQQGFQQSLALSDELRLHFGGGQGLGSSLSATGHTNDHSACFTPGGHSSYLRRTFEFIKYFI